MRLYPHQYVKEDVDGMHFLGCILYYYFAKKSILLMFDCYIIDLYTLMNRMFDS